MIVPYQISIGPVNNCNPTKSLRKFNLINLSFQIDNIVLLGGADHTTTEVTKLMSQLPPAVIALTGVDLSGVLSKIPGAKTQIQNRTSRV